MLRIGLLWSYLFIFFLSFNSACTKKKDKSKEENLKKEILSYQKLDAEQILKVYHTSELSTFEKNIKEKCLLLDLNINSFYTTGEGKKYTFLTIKEYKLGFSGEFKDIESFLNYLLAREKYIGIREFTIESNQTGYHNVNIYIQVLEKNYIDKDFLPAIIKAMVGISVESEDVLIANLKVYQSRYKLVKSLTETNTINWKNRLAYLHKIPEKSYITKLLYIHNINEEQIKLDVISENNTETIKSVNYFFEQAREIRNNLNTFSKRSKPEELSSGLVKLTFVYEK